MKIILVEDQKIMLEILRDVLKQQPDIEVIAEADNGETAIEMAKELSPDAITMDISLPGISGIEATRKILSENKNIKIISLSVHSDTWTLQRMLKAGASGYVIKSSAYEELVKAINAVMKQDFYLCVESRRTIVNEYIMEIIGKDASEQDRQVLHFICERKTVNEISSYLNINQEVIKAYLNQYNHFIKEFYLKNTPL